LKRIIEILKENNNFKIEISGHTDSIGTDEYNLQLSQKRADEIKKYLIQNGIIDNRIISKGYGNTFPITSNQTEAGRAENRRVEIFFKTE